MPGEGQFGQPDASDASEQTSAELMASLDGFEALAW